MEYWSHVPRIIGRVKREAAPRLLAAEGGYCRWALNLSSRWVEAGPGVKTGSGKVVRVCWALFMSFIGCGMGVNLFLV